MRKDEIAKQSNNKESDFAFYNLKASKLIVNPESIKCPELKKSVIELQHQIYIHLNMLIRQKNLNIDDIYDIYTDILTAFYGEEMYFLSVKEYLKEKHGIDVFNQNLIQRGYEFWVNLDSTSN